MRALPLICALLAAGAVSAQPRDFQADYDVLRNGERLGQASIRYQGDAGSADFVTRTRGTDGLAALAGIAIDERSQLRWRVDGPETVDYRFQQKAAFSSRERSVQVDAAAGRVLSTNKDQRFEFAYQPGVLDRHAVTVALMHDLARGKRGELSYPVVDRDELQAQRYRVGARVKLRTALGPLSALRVERLRESANGKTTRIWFARERGYVPLRIIQDDGQGERIEMRITAIR